MQTSLYHKSMLAISQSHFKLNLNQRISLISGVSENFAPLVIAQIMECLGKNFTVIWICSTDENLYSKAQAIKDFVKTKYRSKVNVFPAWDTLPYDRSSPGKDITAARIKTLIKTSNDCTAVDRYPHCVVTSIPAFMQRLQPKENLKSIKLSKGQSVQFQKLINDLINMGMQRVDLVQEVGEFAVRGGIIDIFSPIYKDPIRIDFFDNEIEKMRCFDLSSQRGSKDIDEITIAQCKEILLCPDTIDSFRKKYREVFSVSGDGDDLYNKISLGQYCNGMEYWLPLFYERTDTLLNYISNKICILTDEKFSLTVENYLNRLNDYFKDRINDFEQSNDYKKSSVYKPLPPCNIALTKTEIEEIINKNKLVKLSSIPYEESSGERIDLSKNIRNIHFFAQLRNSDKEKFWISALSKIRNLAADNTVIISSARNLGLIKLSEIFKEHELFFKTINSLEEISDNKSIYLCRLAINEGFSIGNFLLITEKDITGIETKQNAVRSKKVKTENFISDLSTLTEGDFVVHSDHGIGQYKGLIALNVDNVTHDCLVIIYDGGDKLFLPVENIELLTRYGGNDNAVVLDRLGSTNWQMRKARVKNRITELAFKLVETAALRQKQKIPPISIAQQAYTEFCAGFQYDLTEDQQKALNDVQEDLSNGKVMDRLICGDVGFGKTEIALRAAFCTAYSGKQVAIITPTTLLARQHYQNFKSRFEGFSIKLEQLSRFTSEKESKVIRQSLKDGKIDIVIGTHSLLGGRTSFSNLGLIVVDEEQHFGVKQKEHLKDTFPQAHILTLTATPIPRTLQLAVTGVKDLSIIAIPPVDRIAVRTFISVFDSLILREALLREYHRDGQSFYVCPRIEDLDSAVETIKRLVPDLSYVVAHGRMPADLLENSISDFIEKRYDLLISTNIIDSGIDIPNANTLIVHRADQFGLAQLYQLRGRIGRSKRQSYAYFTVQSNENLSQHAQKRLEVLRTLDSLGAGFNLASYDLDIRGAGNLLGAQQSGHIKEVGIALYQQMLSDAVEKVKQESTDEDVITTNDISPACSDIPPPQINLGISVIIPKSYIHNDDLRLSMYRKIAQIKGKNETYELKAELVDRFGKIPKEVDNLFRLILIRNLCMDCGISKLDVGPKSTLISFYNDYFPNPMGLIKFMQESQGKVKIRSDQKLQLNTANISISDLLSALKRIFEIKNQVTS